jgi:acetoin utilization deacetylase AcuC-like enzyme
MSVGILYDPLYLEHRTGQHPENASRLRAVTSRLQAQGLWDQVRHLSPEPAAVDELTAVHAPGYVKELEAIAAAGGAWLTADTVISERSFEAARLAAGAAVAAVREAVTGESPQVFSLSRPPGHHARPSEAMGFCLINNAAVAAATAIRELGLERVFLYDFDVHHGNGTQEIFEADRRVLYASTHQYPAYPGTGAIEEIGTDDGRGFTLNVPMPAGVGDQALLQAFEEVIAPAARRFQPQLFLISAGYDAHWTNGRYLSSIQWGVTIAGFAEVVSRLHHLAQELCDGRQVLILEGGYDPEALGWSVAATLEVLLGQPASDPLGASSWDEPEPDVSPILATVRELHSLG